MSFLTDNNCKQNLCEILDEKEVILQHANRKSSESKD